MDKEHVKRAVESQKATALKSTLVNFNKHPSKISKILEFFLGGKSLNRFEAIELNDHCLPSTVSTLQNSHGIRIDRVRESVPCLKGASTTSVCRYTLAPTESNLEKARKVLALLVADSGEGEDYGT